MKRVVLFGIMLMLFCSGCSAKEEPKQEQKQQEQIQTQSTENTEIEDGEEQRLTLKQKRLMRLVIFKRSLQR